MWPLVKVAQYLNTLGPQKLTLNFSDGQRKDDGIIVLNTQKQQIQFVLAIDGHQEDIRMEHLMKHKHAPAVQDLKWQGSKKNRTLLEQETSAINVDEILKKLESLLEIALRKKIKTDYKGMWLGIVFDDYLLSSSEKSHQKIKAICGQLIRKKSSQIKNIYSKVFFVGLREQGHFIQHYDLANQLDTLLNKCKHIKKQFSEIIKGIFGFS